MARYSSYSQPSRSPEKKREIHPIWRGIGLIFMVLTPLLGYAGALLLIDANNKNVWIPIPIDLLVGGKDPLLLIKVLITLILMFILFAIFQFITFVIYRLFAPPRYGPMDVPQVAFKGKQKSR